MQNTRHTGLPQNLKLLCIKEHNRMKRQPTEWEKTFANYISGKGIISRIYKELLQLNDKKANTDLKLGKGPEETFSEDIQIANKHIKGCST